MEQFAEGLQSMLNWIADLPEGVLGIIFFAIVLALVFRD
jgi:hypothetical protein